MGMGDHRPNASAIGKQHRSQRLRPLGQICLESSASVWIVTPTQYARLPKFESPRSPLACADEALRDATWHEHRAVYLEHDDDGTWLRRCPSVASGRQPWHHNGVDHLVPLPPRPPSRVRHPLVRRMNPTRSEPGCTRIECLDSIWLFDTAIGCYLRTPLTEEPRAQPETGDERAGPCQDWVWHPFDDWWITEDGKRLVVAPRSWDHFWRPLTADGEAGDFDFDRERARRARPPR